MSVLIRLPSAEAPSQSDDPKATDHSFDAPIQAPASLKLNRAEREMRQALDAARAFADVRPLASGVEVEVSPKNFCDSVREVDRLWSLAANLPDSELEIDGLPAQRDELMRYHAVLLCHNQQEASGQGRDYCRLSESRAGWGCHRLRSVGRYAPPQRLHYDPQKFWYDFGKFEYDDSGPEPARFRVDRAAIRAELEREARAGRLHSCPVFSLEDALARADQLPEVIAADDLDWEIVYETRLDPDHPAGKRRVAAGLRPAEDGRFSPQPENASREEDPRRSAEDRFQAKTMQSAGESFTNELRDEDERRARDRKRRERKRYIPETGFAEIGGLDDVVRRVREVVELPLRRPRLFRHLGLKPHKGVLLYGPPGCGKTLLAKAVANEADAHFIAVNGPQVFSKWFGQSEENVRHLFEEAREFAPTVIFFDELDAIAQARSDEETIRTESRMVNQLLTLLDGVEEYENVVILGATNRRELIDSALLRPGRFDYSIEIPMPGPEARRQILDIALENRPLADDFDRDAFAAGLQGLSGADVAFLANEAAYNCLRRSVNFADALSSPEPEDAAYDLQLNAEDFAAALATLRSQKL